MRRRRGEDGPLPLALWIAIVVVVVAVAAGFALPSWTGVRVAPLASVVAMRRGVVAACALLLVGLAAVTIVRRRGGWIPRSAVALVVAGVLIAPVIVAGGRAVATPAAPAAGGIRILSWNTAQAAVPPEAIDDLIRRVRPDVVVFPEYDPKQTGILAALQGDGWYPVLGPDPSATSLFVRRSLGAYRVDTSGVPPYAGFLAVPADPADPTIVVAHLNRGYLTGNSAWLRDLAWAESACDAPGTIAVGDFNATLENLHGPYLGLCRDAATDVGDPDAGTWPTWLPAAFGAQIDRVFTGPGWRATSFVVLDIGAGSDHRPIVADIAPS